MKEKILAEYARVLPQLEDPYKAYKMQERHIKLMRIGLRLGLLDQMCEIREDFDKQNQ